MIKSKERIKHEIMEEIESSVDKYIEKMDESSNEAKFPIDTIERFMGEIIQESRKIITEKTSELINNIDEEDVISKKKANTEKRGK
jgi:hypothetical protein